ncbi:APC family permease [Psychrosphaera algicola]|uniref:Arginine/agmatine antiporter n=1 Tax=Psychrosphaera algicola TaxID=3023714 RepID=A0ABT5FEF4_9GAMM|nr:APC family permease [Psychrosphaera sp. G1-22]MDC2889883.1 APC family permease [Psychrosphaera sp. G1-22]
MATLSTQSITKIGVAAIAINGLIGAGIFALPAAAANQLAYFSPWMFLLCGIAIFPIVACFAILSSAFDQTGGPVLYSTKAFGPFVGFQTGWLLYLGRVSALAANGHALVLYLSLYFPVLQTPEIASIGVCLLIVLLATINILGIKNAMTSIYLVTLAKLLPIALFVLFGVTYINAEQLFSAPPPQLDQFPTSMLLLVYAFIGFEGAIIPAKEAKTRKPICQRRCCLPSSPQLCCIFYSGNCRQYVTNPHRDQCATCYKCQCDNRIFRHNVIWSCYCVHGNSFYFW